MCAELLKPRKPHPKQEIEDALRYVESLGWRVDGINMAQYEFTLRFALPAPETDPDKYLERLLADGCDDAIVGVGQHGRIALTFTRTAPRAIDALKSALSDVKRSIPDASLVEAAPDLVGLTDIAALLNFSRQTPAGLSERPGPDFPSQSTKVSRPSGTWPRYSRGWRERDAYRIND
ncbi:MAG: DNA-binding protein [Woeseiaceae bacterium]|nr:DNA-binding protein [Woeseiaceae bacterium]